jgi:superfamily II RNA helicase
MTSFKINRLKKKVLKIKSENDDAKSSSSTTKKTKVKTKKSALNKVQKAKLKKVNNIITLAFDKKRADDRKGWLKKFDINNTLEIIGDVTYDDFVNKTYNLINQLRNDNRKIEEVKQEPE